MECRLQQLWAEMLNISMESVGRDDNFLKIGGDSIAIIHFVRTAREVRIAITVNDVFDDPRLFAVAAKATDVNDGSKFTDSIPPFSLLDAAHREIAASNKVRDMAGLSCHQSVEDSFPCSKFQEGVMALSVKLPGSHVAVNVYEISKRVDIARFKSCWELTVQMCANLRTRIIIQNGLSLQLIVKDDVEWHDAIGLDLDTYLSASQSSNMGYGTRLCRYAIIAQVDGRNYFVLTLHHAIFDGWTVRIMQKIFHNLYMEAAVLAQEPFSRFIKYTMELDVTAAQEYWMKELHEAKMATFPPPPAASSDRKHQTRILSKSIALPSTSTGMGITKASIIRAAWAIVLARYCDTSDICFGAAVSGRQAPVPGLVEMPGPVVATIPVRVRLDSTQRVSALLHGIQSQATEMVAHEQFGVQNISKINADTKDACSFTSLLVVQPVRYLTEDDDDEALMSFVNLENSQAELLENYFSFPLVVQGHVYEDHLRLVMIYSSSLLVESQIQAMSHQFEHVVHQISSQQDILLGDISMTSDWDLKRSRELNPEEPEIIESCFHRLVEEQALQRPDAPAIQAWDAEFTYWELNQAANRLANYLVFDLGVEPGDLIHVCFEKSAWFFVTILGVNKAGAAWVPLDPSHPKHRLQQIARQTRAQLALISPSNAELCASLCPLVVEVSSSHLDRLARSSKYEQSMDASSPDHDAYILFTSGSTGTPKGFVIQHRALCTSQWAICKRLRLTSKVKMLQFASYVFDMSVGETVLTLISGACVCVPSEHTRMNELKQFIRDMDISWIFLTPSFARTLSPSEIPSVELLILAGEGVPRDVFDNWVGKVRLVNGWGPAETCVCSTLHEWTSSTESPLTVGSPVGGFCWIVDAQDPMKLAPIGTIGEVVIQGPTILREYLADPERTRSTTVTKLPDWAPKKELPHWNRFYKSGDLAFYNPDGTIEFSGRKDTQVKVRGLRVELGEVEHQVQTVLDGARQVAVDIMTTENGSSLICYFCSTFEIKNMTRDTDAIADDIFLPLTDDTKPLLAAALGQLKVVLPRYMVPTYFIHCRFMPFITSTKLDRKKLREIIISSTLASWLSTLNWTARQSNVLLRLTWNVAFSNSGPLPCGCPWRLLDEMIASFKLAETRLQLSSLLLQPATRTLYSLSRMCLTIRCYWLLLQEQLSCLAQPTEIFPVHPLNCYQHPPRTSC